MTDAVSETAILQVQITKEQQIALRMLAAKRDMTHGEIIGRLLDHLEDAEMEGFLEPPIPVLSEPGTEEEIAAAQKEGDERPEDPYPPDAAQVEPPEGSSGADNEF